MLHLVSTAEEEGKAHFQIGRALSDEEGQRYLAACEHLREFESSRTLRKLLDTNLAGVEDAITRFNDAMRAGGSLQRGPGAIGGRDLNEKVVNLLTAIRLYLDHTATRLSRRYGKQSAPYQAYFTAQKAAYDRGKDYAFVYKLRNYVQHCGMPLQVLRTTTSVPEIASIPQETYTSLIGCDRDMLLRDFDSWGGARLFLEERPAEFELLPHLKAAVAEVEMIDREWAAASVPDLWKDARAIGMLIAEAADDTHAGTVADYLPAVAEGQFELRFRDPPLATLQAIGLVVPRRRFPGYVIHRPRLAVNHPPGVV